MIAQVIGMTCRGKYYEKVTWIAGSPHHYHNGCQLPVAGNPGMIRQPPLHGDLPVTWATRLTPPRAHSPQMLSPPLIQDLTMAVVTDLGLSMGNPSALSQQRLANTPRALLTEKSTV